VKIIEICGVAGSGKSTLYRSLRDELMNDGVALYDHQFPVHRKLRQLPLGMWRLAPILPWIRIDKSFWDRFKLLLYLEMLVNELSGRKDQNSGLIVFDQGPIFVHAALMAREVVSVNDLHVRSWLFSNFRRFANVIDGLIWLDAPNAILLERVATRSTYHVLSTFSKEEKIFLQHLLKDVDLFIGGGGTINTESCFLGTPTISTRSFISHYDKWQIDNNLMVWTNDENELINYVELAMQKKLTVNCDVLNEMDRRYFLVRDLRWEFAMLDRERKGTISERSARFLFQAIHDDFFSQRRWVKFLRSRIAPGSEISFAEMPEINTKIGIINIVMYHNVYTMYTFGLTEEFY